WNRLRDLARREVECGLRLLVRRRARLPVAEAGGARCRAHGAKLPHVPRADSGPAEALRVAQSDDRRGWDERAALRSRLRRLGLDEPQPVAGRLRRRVRSRPSAAARRPPAEAGQPARGVPGPGPVSPQRRARFTCTTSEDGGKTWLPPVAATTVLSDETRRPANVANGYGDYEGVAAADGRALAAWTDGRQLKRLGEEIYAARLGVRRG